MHLFSLFAPSPHEKESCAPMVVEMQQHHDGKVTVVAEAITQGRCYGQQVLS
jgi:hypothetical protein